MTISPELHELLSRWLEKASSPTPYPTGLCGYIHGRGTHKVIREFTIIMQETYPDTIYPFNEGSFFYFQAETDKHLNPKRLAFVHKLLKKEISIG